LGVEIVRRRSRAEVRITLLDYYWRSAPSGWLPLRLRTRVAKKGGNLRTAAKSKLIPGPKSNPLGREVI
jgi:hypothetical protein